MSRTSDTEFYSLSLNSISPPPLPTYEDATRQPDARPNNDEKKSSLAPRVLVRQLTPHFLRTPNTENLEKDGSATKSLAWTHKLSNLIINWWLWELLSWFMSAFAIFAMALILGYYDGRAVPDRWPLGITLNAYISVLSGIAKYLLAVPVDEALGQLKWLWFSRGPPKPLVDFERFDDASRGPWGALALLVRVRCKSIASLGAIITILSLVVDPFFQQLVSLPKRPSLLGQSAVPIVANFTLRQNIFSNGTSGDILLASDDILSDVIGAFMHNNGTRYNIPAFCPTDDCSWKPFDTLGMCSSCADVSHMLTFACLEESGQWRSSVNVNMNSTNVFSCGYFLNATSDNPILMSGYTVNTSTNEPGEALLMTNLNLVDVNTGVAYWGGSVSFNNSGFPVNDFIQVVAPDAASVYQNSTPIARECVFRYCTKRISASYEAGNYTEYVLSTSLDTSTPFEPLFLDSGFNWDFFKTISITPPGSSRTFSVPNITSLSTIFTFQDYFPLYSTADNTSATPIIRTRNWLGFTPELWDYPYNPFAAPNDGEAYIANMSTMITNAIRTYPGTTETVNGTGSVETYIHVQWGWITLPLVLVLFVFILLVVIILNHHKEDTLGIWKTSSLASMANGLDESGKEAFGSTHRLYDVFEHAANVKVALRLESGRHRLVVVEEENAVLARV